MTGLGTPVANLLVPNLVSYQGPGTSYQGPSVGPLQSATLVDPTAAASAPTVVFSVFDSLTVASNGIGHARSVGTGSASRAIVKMNAWGPAPTPGTTSQGLLALDSVISNWTPVSNSMTKRLTRPAAAGMVSLDLGKDSVLPAMNVGTRSLVLDAGLVDALVAGDHHVWSLLAGKGQRPLSQTVKTLGRLT